MSVRRSFAIRLIFTALVLGIGIGAFWDNNFAYWLIGGFGAFALAVSAIARNKIVYLTGILLLVFCFGGIWARLSEPIIDQSHIGFYNGQKIKVSGIVSEDPEQSDSSRRYVIGDLKFLDNDEINLSGRILVTAKPYPEYGYGDVLEVDCKLEKPMPFNDFAYDKYLAKSDIYSICSYPQIILASTDKGNFIRSSFLDFKHYFLSRLEMALPATSSALAAGLLIGGQGNVPAELKKDFSAVGLSHILAVSGFNITIIGQAIYWICARAPLMNRRRAFYLSLILIFSFVLIAGFEASIIRAAIMGILVLAAEQIGRRRNGLSLLLVAAVIMLLFNPKLLLWDVGFQLSFLATFGLLEIAPKLEKYFLRIPDYWELRKTFVATISAQIMTLPIIAMSFHILSLIAPLTNILVLPLVPYAMLFVLIIGIFALISVQSAIVFSLIPLLLIWCIIFIVRFFANLPFASLEINSYWVVWIAFTLFMLFIFKKELSKLAAVLYV